VRYLPLVAETDLARAVTPLNPRRCDRVTSAHHLRLHFDHYFLSPRTRYFDLTKMDATEVHQTALADEPINESAFNDALEQDGMDIVPKTEEEYSQSMLTLRAIVSSKEAGVIIGKAGKNVADLRDETGVKAGVSKVVPGVHDRVLTVTGPLSGVASAYAIVAKGLLEGAPQMGMGGVVSNNGTHRKSLEFLSPLSNMDCGTSHFMSILE
jgi:hypothetical protein